MNNQKILDKVLTAIRKQKVPSVIGEECRYRLKKNGVILKCAAGHLIPAKDYNKNMEGFPIYDSACQNLAFNYFIAKGYDVLFIRDIQQAHDNSVGNNFLKNFEKEMKLIAKNYNLVYKPIEQVKNA